VRAFKIGTRREAAGRGERRAGRWRRTAVLPADTTGDKLAVVLLLGTTGGARAVVTAAKWDDSDLCEEALQVERLCPG
jgi:hypothetical protein